jgi:hypothetical protein
MVGCTGLTNDIDLTNCPEITQVDASGTTVNVLIPENSKITKYELGTPTRISIISPTQLNYINVNVDDSTNIDSLDIINATDNNSFKMFGKIMNV